MGHSSSFISADIEAMEYWFHDKCLWCFYDPIFRSGDLEIRCLSMLLWQPRLAHATLSFLAQQKILGTFTQTKCYNCSSSAMEHAQIQSYAKPRVRYWGRTRSMYHVGFISMHTWMGACTYKLLWRWGWYSLCQTSLIILSLLRFSCHFRFCDLNGDMMMVFGLAVHNWLEIDSCSIKSRKNCFSLNLSLSAPLDKSLAGDFRAWGAASLSRLVL